LGTVYTQLSMQKNVDESERLVACGKGACRRDSARDETAIVPRSFARIKTIISGADDALFQEVGGYFGMAAHQNHTTAAITHNGKLIRPSPEAVSARRWNHLKDGMDA